MGPPIILHRHSLPLQDIVTDSLRDLAQKLDAFARERDWQPFHSPKNLASALIVEAGELLEHFQWLTEEQSRELSPERRDVVAGEIADVLLYLIQLSSALGVDPVAAAQTKLRLNAERYPVDKSRGNARKHDEL
jgi:NTP pyrophosphatase (non-canonical NTP hydrolase)